MAATKKSRDELAELNRQESALKTKAATKSATIRRESQATIDELERAASASASDLGRKIDQTTSLLKGLRGELSSRNYRVAELQSRLVQLSGLTFLATSGELLEAGTKRSPHNLFIEDTANTLTSRHDRHTLP